MSLNSYNDRQNHLLTQLSYESHILQDNYNGKSLQTIYEELKTSLGKNNSTVKRLKEMCDCGMGDLVVKDVENNPKTGFGAIAFEDSSGNVGVSYRGTDGMSAKSLNDWADNIVAGVSGTSPQVAQAEAFFDKNRDPNGNNYLYGHSKGGNLSQAVFVNHYNEIKEIHNLNPQPINPYSLTPDQIAALNTDKVDVVVTEGDYVWFLGAICYESRIRVMDKKGGDSHTYSSDRYDENGNINPGSQPWWEYLAVGGITILSPFIQVCYGGIGLIYNTMVRVIDFIKNDLIPFAHAVVESVVDALKKLGDTIRSFAEAISNYFNDFINGFKDWWNKNFNAGYKYANANPQIKINTDRMKEYASALSRLYARSRDLDGRMNNMYWTLPIEWDAIPRLKALLKAEIILDFAGRLNKCSDYLNKTANDFERAENEIKGSLG